MRAKTERNAALVAYYAEGALLREVSARFGIDTSLCGKIIRRSGYRLTPEQKRARYAHLGGNRGGGRAAHWPDCPEHLRAEYKRLRRKMSVADARYLLERDMAA